MNDGLKDKYRKAIIKIIAACPRVERAVLFGSRAIGTFTPTSDVDIALFGDELTLTDLADMAAEIEELTMPQSVDLILYRTIKNKKLIKHIKEHGVQWHPENEERVKDNLPDGWERTTLGDIITTNDKTYSKKDNWKFINYLDTGNLTENKISEVQHLIIDKDKIPSRAKRKVQPGDIVYSTVRPNQKHYGILKNPPQNMLVSTGFVTIRAKHEFADTNFTYWFLSQPQIIDKLQTIGENSTSAYPSIKPSDIEELRINLPPLPEQRAIAHILGSLDDKIELNRRMNETLEAMAQALFKSWFVDFDPVIDNALAAGKSIPEELKEKAEIRKALGNAGNPLPEELRKLFPAEFEHTEEMGWIPKGWRSVTLDNLVNLIGGGTPKTSINEYWNGEIPWFSVVDTPNVSDVFVIDTGKHITTLGVEKSSTKILPVGTTIITARGTVGKCAMVGKAMAMNQSCYGVRGKDCVSDSFVYYVIREKVTDLQRGGHGSVFNTITRDTFKTIKIAFGQFELTKKMEDLIKHNFDRILANRFHSTALSNLRDTLLPKLLSGEIRIPEAEKLVEGLR